MTRDCCDQYHKDVEALEKKGATTSDAQAAADAKHQKMHGMKNNLLSASERRAVLANQGRAMFGTQNDNGFSDADVNAKAWELFKTHWDGLSSAQQDKVYEALEKEQGKK